MTRRERENFCHCYCLSVRSVVLPVVRLRQETASRASRKRRGRACGNACAVYSGTESADASASLLAFAAPPFVAGCALSSPQIMFHAAGRHGRGDVGREPVAGQCYVPASGPRSVPARDRGIACSDEGSVVSSGSVPCANQNPRPHRGQLKSGAAHCPTVQWIAPISTSPRRDGAGRKRPLSIGPLLRGASRAWRNTGSRARCRQKASSPFCSCSSDPQSPSNRDVSTGRGHRGSERRGAIRSESLTAPADGEGHHSRGRRETWDSDQLDRRRPHPFLGAA